MWRDECKMNDRRPARPGRVGKRSGAPESLGTVRVGCLRTHQVRSPFATPFRGFAPKLGCRPPAKV